ncbi:hypothetical protein FRC02_003480 [Tulasnella sp. 418]|nr:hypothetical protein FRC02_003480 [Tulasnella sp. 418]
MGIFGLSTYLRDNHRTCGSDIVLDLENKAKLSKPLIVDSWSFIYFLRNDQLYKEPWVYGGEYEYFSRIAKFVVRAWLKLFPQVYFIFDGAYPEIKFPEIIKRIQQSRIMPANLFWRTSAERRNQHSFLRQNKILPVLAYQACVSAMQDLASEGVQCIWANDEADRRCVELAGDLNGWVTGMDSDFAVLNVDGYAGYLPMDEMVWTFAAASEEDEEVGSDQEGEGWSGVKSKKKKQKNKMDDGTTRLGVIPPSDNIVGLTMRVYHPNDLAQHLGIRPPFLPLFASLVGNDFIPELYKSRFFPRGMTSKKRIERVAEVIRDASTPSKGRKRKATLAQESGGVAALIDQAVQKLLLRDDVPSAQIEEMVETVIESILQYVVDTDLRGPFSSKPKSPKHVYQSEVELKYTEAYRNGEFSPYVLNMVTTGTCWTNLGLEDPDAESVTKTVGEEITVWIGSVLNDGIPIGVEELGDGASTGRSSVVGDHRKPEETDEEDEDELISVVEEDSSNETERSLSRRRLREEEHESEDDDADSYSDYPPFTNGVPVAMLTTALQRLRREQKKALPPDSSQLQSPVTESSFISTPAPEAASASLGPVSIMTYFRRGGRVTPAPLSIPPLSHLISSTSRGRGSSKSGLKVNWQGPIQLQPIDTRLKLFLHALNCNTSSFRNLDEEWMLVAVALRWVVVKMSEKMNMQPGGGGNMKWKKSEARAFLLSCVRTYLAGTSADTPSDILTGSMITNLTNSASDWSMLVTPTASSSFIWVAGQSAGSTAQPTSILEATPRAIQMSAQILIGIEKCHQLAQVLLLSKRVTSAERKFSGRTFHSLLGTIQEERMTPEEAEIFDRLWNAIEEDGRAEWWADESLSKKEKKKEKKAAKIQTGANGAPVRGRSKTVTAGGMFGALAEVTM